MPKQRIQKVLAQAGVASRRGIEQMVLEGLITVNGKLVTELPCFVEDGDDVRIDGQPVRKRRPRDHAYYLVNKSTGVVCTQRDPQGRPRAIDLLPAGVTRRLYCVGRLDADSTGIIVLTDDGDLTEYLTHPRYGVPKTYMVEVEGRLGEEQMEKLKAGVYLDGKPTGRARVKVLRAGRERSVLEIQLTEGRNREIRRILRKLGNKVRRLKRVAIGPITDRGLKIGHCRILRRDEVEKLRRCGQPSKPGSRRARKPKGDTSE